jgi:two-component system cell cycle response regulator
MPSRDEILHAKILVVDDSADNVDLMLEILREAGYTNVASTMLPEQVCPMHRQQCYDLILLDLQMPGLNGFQVMKGLKEIEQGGYLPVLALTAQPSFKIAALEAGARDFICSKCTSASTTCSRCACSTRSWRSTAASSRNWRCTIR